MHTLWQPHDAQRRPVLRSWHSYGSQSEMRMGGQHMGLLPMGSDPYGTHFKPALDPLGQDHVDSLLV